MTAAQIADLVGSFGIEAYSLSVVGTPAEQSPHRPPAPGPREFNEQQRQRQENARG